MSAETLSLFIVALTAAVLVAVIAAFINRRIVAKAHDDRARSLEAELAQLRADKAEAERGLAAEKRTAERVPSLERALGEHEAYLLELRDAKAASEIELSKVKETAARLGMALEASQQRCAELEASGRDAASRIEAVFAEKAAAEEALAARSASLEAREGLILDLKGRIEALERSDADVKQQLEAAGRARAELEARLAEALAIQTEKSEAADKVRREFAEEKAQHDASRKQVVELSAKLAAVNEKLDQEMSKAAEKIALLDEARAAMANQFQVLAEGVMTRHGEVFTKQNKEQVEGILNPLREKIAEFQQGLQAAHTETAKDRATLAEQIRSLSEASTRMTSETHNLTKALKGKAQTQGAWGEMILSTILEKSGLREGDEYVKQESHTDENGGRHRPDVIVNLPGGQRVVIDAKVSLTAFEEYVNAASEEQSRPALVRHLASLRGHIRTLASKEYQSVVGSGLDYVLLFVPIEGALAVALQEAPELTAEAAEANVAIATPTTLMMALRTIANVWGVERRNRNADAIADRAGKLYDKFLGFLTDMQTLGGQLDRAKGSFDDAMGKLSSGRGNIVRQVETLKDLGAKTTKSLPGALLEEAAAVALSAPLAANTSEE